MARNPNLYDDISQKTAISVVLYSIGSILFLYAIFIFAGSDPTRLGYVYGAYMLFFIVTYGIFLMLGLLEIGSRGPPILYPSKYFVGLLFFYQFAPVAIPVAIYLRRSLLRDLRSGRYDDVYWGLVNMVALSPALVLFTLGTAFSVIYGVSITEKGLIADLFILYDLFFLVYALIGLSLRRYWWILVEGKNPPSPQQRAQPQNTLEKLRKLVEAASR